MDMNAKQLVPQGCRLLSLPEELIELITDQLELPDLNSLCRTCSRLHRFTIESLCRLYESKTLPRQTCIDWAIWTDQGRLEVVNRAIEDGNVAAKLSNLAHASLRGQIDIVRRLLLVPSVLQEWKATATEEGRFNAPRDSPLACAVRENHEDVVEALLAVPDIDDVALRNTRCATDARIDPAICVAAKSDNARIIALLLDRGASIESTNLHSQTPLQIAAQCGSSDAFVELIRRGADIYNVPRNEQSFMHMAARHNAAMVQALLDKGHPPNNFAVGNNTTPLTIAAMHNRCDVLRLLVKHGAVFPIEASTGKTLLMIASHFGRFEFVQVLLSLDIDVNAQDNKGKTALFHALATHETAIDNIEYVCKILLEAGADPNHVCGEGHTALAELCNRAQVSGYSGCGWVEVYGHMTHFGARDLNPKASSNGLSLLQWALYSEQTKLLDMMLETGVKFDFGEWALSHFHPDASCYFLDRIHTPEMLHWLLEHGMTLNFRDRRGRPLLHNLLWDYRGLLRRTLILAGANIEAVDMDGNTALHRACIDGDIHHKPAINELIKRGANLWSTNDEGMTPLEVAQQNERPIAVKILQRHLRKQRVAKRAELRALRTRSRSSVDTLDDEGLDLDLLSITAHADSATT